LDLVKFGLLLFAERFYDLCPSILCDVERVYPPFEEYLKLSSIDDFIVGDTGF
jgi:hypothetical protein